MELWEVNGWVKITQTIVVPVSILNLQENSTKILPGHIEKVNQVSNVK